MTKPLHSTTWRTESDCGVQVDVAEGRTTEWAPFREIVVTTDAGMTPAEARRLIADLQHAIALAEEATSEDEDDSEESPVVVIPENPIQRANRQNRAACYAYGRFDADPIRYVPSAQFIALVTERGVDTEGFRSLYNELLAAKTAAAEDQPKPREAVAPRRFGRGERQPLIGARLRSILYPTHVFEMVPDQPSETPEHQTMWHCTACAPGVHAVAAVTWPDLQHYYGSLSEVLADPEEQAS